MIDRVTETGAIILRMGQLGKVEPTRLDDASAGMLGYLGKLHRAMLLVAGLGIMAMIILGLAQFSRPLPSFFVTSQQSELFAALALALLAVGAGPRPSASLTWRCIALCAAALAVMTMLGQGANRLFVIMTMSQTRPTVEESLSADPLAFDLLASLGVLLLAIGEGLSLCRLSFARSVLLISGVCAGLAVIGSLLGLVGFQAVSTMLFGVSSLAITGAALLGQAAPTPRTLPQRPPDLDVLTGLLTRNAFDRLVEAQGAAGSAAMMLIDIDRFRAANHVLGSKTADDILVEIAKRLRDLAAPYPVARTGSDEFAIFCHPIEESAAQAMAQRLVAAMTCPFALSDDRNFYLTTSVGLAHSAIEGVGDLRDAADEAVFIAKNQGGNQAVPFLRAQHDARVERIELEQDLYTAFRNDNEIFLVYQPIVRLRDQSVIAIEALARWQHPTAGLVPPSRFVGIAEAAGLFSGLGAKIRELAVRQVAAWRDSGIANLPVLNLNVSPLELSYADVPGTLGALVDRYGLPRSAFCLEVTEGTFADENAARTLQAARDAGFLVAMDDFGVGYSSLTQLPKLPLTSLKLDRGFLKLARSGDGGISLFATIVQLAHVLKLPVVAEGVETPDELAMASDCGCDFVQGYFFARPLSPAQIELCLRSSPQDGGPIRLVSPPLRPDGEAKLSSPVLSCTT